MTKNQERIYNIYKGLSNSELKAMAKAVSWGEKTVGFIATVESIKAVKSFGKGDYFKGVKAVVDGYDLEERKAKLEAQHERELPQVMTEKERQDREYWNRKVN